MLMLTRTHRREMAAKDEAISVLEKDAHHWWERYNRKSVEVSDLRARPRQVHRPRERGQGGRFVKGGAK